MLKPHVPGLDRAWVLQCVQKGDARSKLAISDLNSPTVYVYDVRSGSEEPIKVMDMHTAPVTVMKYSQATDTVISSDRKGEESACLILSCLNKGMWSSLLLLPAMCTTLLGVVGIHGRLNVICYAACLLVMWYRRVC